MRVVPAAITTARQSEAAKLCRIWELVRPDGTAFRFTDHNADVEVDGDLYVAVASFDPSAIKASGDLSVDDMDVQGAFDSAYITERDLLAGLYHGATFSVAEVLWDDADAGVDVLRTGTIGRVKATGGAFVAELLGPTVPLQRQFGEVTQPQCRATLGDARCGATLDEQYGIVTAVSDRREFEVSGLTMPESGYFTHGLLSWMLGPNAGQSMEVAACDGTTVTLTLEMFSLPEVGDEFAITAGCDHSIAMCKARFDNVLRFRGEPYKPVSDDIIKGPVRQA